MNIDGAFVLNRKTFDIRFHEPGYKYPVVIQLWRFKGFFKENLELEHFPVDVQVCGLLTDFICLLFYIICNLESLL